MIIYVLLFLFLSVIAHVCMSVFHDKNQCKRCVLKKKCDVLKREKHTNFCHNIYK